MGYKRICKVQGCSNKHSAKGYCNKHYLRALNGKPLKKVVKSLEERLMEKIVFGGDCWLWSGAKSGGDGREEYKYGYINIDGKAKRAHRVMYEIKNNVRLNSDDIILHVCDTPLCVNPEHLTLGTQMDNNIDAINKGRMWHPCGEDNHSKLKEADVLEIRSLASEGKSYACISRMFSVSSSSVRNIVLRNKWKHL